jgi:hypothetical protein
VYTMVGRNTEAGTGHPSSGDAGSEDRLMQARAVN